MYLLFQYRNGIPYGMPTALAGHTDQEAMQDAAKKIKNRGRGRGSVPAKEFGEDGFKVLKDIGSVSSSGEIGTWRNPGERIYKGF